MAGRRQGRHRLGSQPPSIREHCPPISSRRNSLCQDASANECCLNSALPGPGIGASAICPEIPRWAEGAIPGIAGVDGAHCRDIRCSRSASSS